MILTIIVIVSLLNNVAAFTLPHANQRNGHLLKLFCINEWRDLPSSFDTPRLLGTEQGGLPKEINILPFPFDEVLLQGETKQLRLYEDRFMKLFEDSMSSHCGVVAMGLLAPAENGIIQTVPLCEVEAFNRMDEFGVFCSIRAVARARLVDVTKQEPFIKAVCLEISDTIPPNMELPNILATNINETMWFMDEMESKLSEANDTESGKDDELMERRINVAKLDDKFYDDLDDGGEEPSNGRGSRFQTAFKVAKEFDTGGYLSKISTSTPYSVQELTALSWAAFCTEINDASDATFRIQALDCDNLFDRLKMASHMLKAKKKKLQAKLNRANIGLRGEEEEEDDEKTK